MVKPNGCSGSSHDYPGEIDLPPGFVQKHRHFLAVAIKLLRQLAAGDAFIIWP